MVQSANRKHDTQQRADAILFLSKRFSPVSQNWIFLKPHVQANNPTLPLKYRINRPEPKPFPSLFRSYPDPDTQSKKVRKVQPRSYFPTPIKQSDLYNSPQKGAQGHMMSKSAIKKNNFSYPHGLNGTFSHLAKRWNDSTEEYNLWKLKRAVNCFGPSSTADGETETPIESVSDGNDAEPDDILLRSGSQNITCKNQSENLDHVVEALANDDIKPQRFDRLLDADGEFPEESVSSFADNDASASANAYQAPARLRLIGQSAPHQRKFRRLRRATRNLIAWIESLSPHKQLHFHLVTSNDGKTVENVPMKPYLAYAEQQQPCPVIDENEIVETVKNAYGLRPALTLKVAIHDIENLPEELEKFDNVYYLKKKIVEDRIYRLPKKTEKNATNPAQIPQLRTANKCSFGFAPTKNKREINAVGTIYDSTSGQRCRYGAWYLRRPLWKKMDVTDEIKRPGIQESDEAFERVTGQKCLRAVDSALLASNAENVIDKSVCQLYASKEFYRLLKRRGHPIPLWLRPCEGTDEYEGNDSAVDALEDIKTTAGLFEEKNGFSKVDALQSYPLPGVRQKVRSFSAGVKVMRDILSDLRKGDTHQEHIDETCYTALENIEKTLGKPSAATAVKADC